jgi:hypothetical protein
MTFRSVYIIVANTALLYWLLQFGACVGLRTYYDVVLPAVQRAPMSEAVKQNYAHMSAEDRDDLRETASRLRFRYQKVVGIMQDQTASRFINVDEHGIRSNGQGHRGLGALDGAIWFLGGSTTFGDGVADSETIPAQLERLIGRPVINLGVPAFATALENLLLNEYLRLGYRPAGVLFLDGINETCEPDPYVSEMSGLLHRAQFGYSWDIGGPVTVAYLRAVRKVKRMTGLLVDKDPRTIACSHGGRPYPLSAAHTRLLAERDAICRLYQIDCHTLVQPFAGIHGRHDDLSQADLESEGWREVWDVFTHLEPVWRAGGAVFVTDAFDGYNRHPFIDETHYSADACRQLAEVIAQRLNLGRAATPPAAAQP